MFVIFVNALDCAHMCQAKSWSSGSCILSRTHPLKKGLDKKIYAWHLTPVFIVIYQAEHNLWCPENVGWENFAKLKIFKVKYGKNG